MKPDDVITIDDNVWPYFNLASFDQDKIVSHGAYQYTLYWAADQTLVLARRHLPGNSVQTLRFTGYHLSINPKDGHRNTVLGISVLDGRLHLSWDHHCDDLRYTKSVASFLTDPPDVMAWADFEPAQPLTADAPQSVTYPRFFNDNQGGLFLIYRTGGSGSGDAVLSRYDADSTTWSITASCLFSKEGTYAPWENSTSRNAYLHDVLFDANGRLHITWTYRETYASWASNHDLHYACSDDQGATWLNNAGQQIADLTKGDSLTLDDPGIVVWEIPVYSWLMNQCGMALDANNQPHVALMHMAKPFVPDDLAHDPPADVVHRLAFFHYWRGADGTWHKSDPIEFSPHENGRTRPGILVDADNNVFVFWASNKGHHCHVAFAHDGYATRATVPMTGPEFRITDASKPDRRRLRDQGVLSFIADPSGTSENRSFAIVDLAVDRLLREARAAAGK